LQIQDFRLKRFDFLGNTDTNALNILTPQVVIASPKGAAISFFMGLLRRSAPRNDKLLNAFVLVYEFPMVNAQWSLVNDH